MDQKASRLLQLNLVVVGVLLSVVSLVVGDVVEQTGVIGSVVNVYSLAGVLSLFLSMVCAGLTYTMSDMVAGADPNRFRKTVDESGLEELYETILDDYGRAIEFNDETNDRNRPLVTLTILFTLYGIGLFIIAVADAALTGYFVPGTKVVIVTLFVVVTWRSGVHGQALDWAQHNDRLWRVLKDWAED